MENSNPNAVEQAMETTLTTVAAFNGQEACEYLTSLITASVSLLRSADEGFLYGFLRSALASLGKPVSVVPNPYGGELGVAVHMGASIANPDAIQSVEELRRELHAANEQLIERDIQLADQKVAMARIVQDFGPIAVAHYKKNAPLVYQLLDEFCKRNLVVKNAPSTMH
ncbi:hypothetical protein B0T40_15610 [Chromobacterium haemolyticum]|uniref:hypothetical protein n=1 Tax=Chromobacterium haemolyticum TaxID=394935 RepID=UPI0009DAB00C|nr:hypothetical protein [Chromobacterium haemolyticum]OQS34269.1 hypothetical protein B0T40_15610 [Chromobacterium haemolyticum]